jgi:pimeloyl-ACP methyl ester carboxylesterase
MTRLAWQRAGARSSGTPRPTVVLLHAWAGSGSDWEAGGWTGELTRAGYDVLVPDLPGHADSAAVAIPEGTEPGPWTAGEILADLEHLHVKQAAVIAYREAGSLAAHLAVRDPEQIVRVVLIGCDDHDEDPLASESADALRQGRTRLWNFEIAELVRRARRDRRHDPATLATWLSGRSWPATPRLKALETPVLLAVGTEDSHREHAPHLAARFADARLVTVPGDDRTAISAPALVDAVRNFLDDTE